MSTRLCPHCGITGEFEHVATHFGKWGKDENRFSTEVILSKCSSCEGITVRFYRAEDNEQSDNYRKLYEWITYPIRSPQVENSVPQAVAEDFVSAVNCESIGELKAAALMYRSSLQHIMREKEAEGHSPIEQLDNLVSKQLIPPDFKDWANEISYWQTDSGEGLEQISLEEVKSLRKFMKRLFDYLYVMPAKINASRYRS